MNIKAKQKKVILIYPKGEEDEWNWMPWSALGIAQAVKDKGYDVYVWDQRVQSEEELFGQLGEDVLCCGISTMIGVQIKHGISIVRRIRDILPDAPIVWGGPFITANVKDSIESELVDIAVQGPGELPMLDVIDDIERYRAGVGCKKIYRGYLKDIDACPRWKFGLIDVKKYINPETHAMAYFTSYGCVHDCAFCSIGNTRWKSLSDKTVIDELDYLVNTYKLKTVIFPDANFFPIQKRIRALSENILKRGLKIKWHANARADELMRYSDETLDLMVKSGCQMFLLGVETAAKKLLPLVNKGESVEVIESFVKRMAKYPITIQLLFIFALPRETPRDTMETIEFCQKLESYNRRTIPSPHFYIPLPGTKLSEEAVKLGYNPPQKFEEWGDLDWKNIDTSVWLKEEDRYEIKSLVDKHITNKAIGRARLLRSNDDRRQAQKAGKA